MKRFNRGQEAIEFALISGLVFVVAIGSFMIFGDKLAGFFSKDSGSAISKTANSSAPSVDTSADTQYQADFDTELAYETLNVGGQAVIEKDDGTVVFSVSGQTVNIPPSAMNYINTTLQTSGASGAEDVISAITQIIKEEKAKYPDSDVPLELAFGKSQRDMDKEGFEETHYLGTAEINTASVKVGNRIIIVSKDQGCKGSCDYTGTYTIDGTYNPATKQYKANVSSDDTKTPTTGKLVTTFDLEKGINFKDAQYFQDGNVERIYDWSMNFSDSEKSFNL